MRYGGGEKHENENLSPDDFAVAPPARSGTVHCGAPETRLCVHCKCSKLLQIVHNLDRKHKLFFSA